MVQIIEENRRPSLGSQFAKAFANAGQAGAQLIPEHFRRKAENRALGISEEIHDPGLRKIAAEAEVAKNKVSDEMKLASISDDTIKKYYGSEAADLWKAATVQGKSDLMKWFIESTREGLDIQDQIKRAKRAREEFDLAAGMGSGMGNESAGVPPQPTMQEQIPDVGQVTPEMGNFVEPQAQIESPQPTAVAPEPKEVTPKPTGKKTAKVPQSRLALVSDDKLTEWLQYPGLKAQAQAELDRRKEYRKEFKEAETIERKPTEEAVQKFFTDLGEDEKKLPELKNSLDTMLHSVNSGAIDPWTPSHLADIATAFGIPEDLTRAWQSMEAKQFHAARKTYLSNTLKEAFRGATTGREIDLAESLLAQVGTNREGNLAALFLQQSNLLIRDERIKLAREAQDQGMSNYDVPRYVAEKIEPFRKELSKEYFEALDSLKAERDAKKKKK